MMMHHATTFPSARVAYHFSPVLPAWPWMTSACLAPHCHRLPHCLWISTLLDVTAHLFPYWSLWLVTVAGHGLHRIIMHLWFSPELLPVQFLDFLLHFLFIIFCNPVPLAGHVGHDLSSCLLWPGGLSDCTLSPISAFFPWDHCGSGKRQVLCSCVLGTTSCSKMFAVCWRPSTASVWFLYIADWWRGSQTSGAEGSVRRRWWKTSVCPQDSKGKSTMLMSLQSIRTAVCVSANEGCPEESLWISPVKGSF